MRNCLFIFILLTLGDVLFAQDASLKISPLRFQGVRDMTGPDQVTRGYHTLYRLSGTDWGMDLLDSSLNLVKQVRIQVPRNAFFHELAYDGASFFIIFVEASFKRELTYVVLDGSGNETNRITRTGVPFLNQGEIFYPSVYAHPLGGFVLFELTRNGKRSGYSVEYFDSKLNVKWRQAFDTDKGSLHIYDARGNSNMLVFVEGNERNGNILSTQLVALETSSGARIYQYPFRNEDNVFFPSSIHLSEDGVAAAAGLYYRGSNIRGGNARGMFFVKIDERGKQMAQTLSDWKSLRPTMQSAVNIWLTRINPSLWIHHLDMRTDGSYFAVGELFRYRGEALEKVPGSNREAVFHRNLLLDFITFEIDNKAQIKQINRIARPHQLLKTEKPDDLSTETKGLAYTFDRNTSQIHRFRALKKYGGLSFRHSRYVAENKLLMSFIQYEASVKTAYVMNAISPQRVFDVPLTKSKPKWFSFGEYVVNLSAQYETGENDELPANRIRYYDESDELFSGVLPRNGAKVLVYQYQVLKGELSLSLVSLEEL